MKKCLIMFVFLVLAISVAAYLNHQDQKRMDERYALSQVDAPLRAEKAKVED